MAMAGKADEDGLLFTGGFAAQCFINRATNGVTRFRGGNNAFGTGKLNASLEGSDLRHGNSFQHFFMEEL